MPPNAMVTNQPALNTFATQGRMPPSADQMNAPLSPQDQIVQRSMKRRTLMNQVPPEDRPRVESQLDLYETIDAANRGFDRLATAGGIAGGVGRSVGSVVSDLGSIGTSRL